MQDSRKIQRTLQKPHMHLPSDIKIRDTKLNYQSTCGHSKTTKSLSTQKIIKQCKPYNNITKKCNLCLFEKFIIIFKKDHCSVNRRNALASSCPHRNRYLVNNFTIKKHNLPNYKQQSHDLYYKITLFLYLITTVFSLFCQLL